MALLPRCAVVDLGSNSVRLVVYEGLERNPVVIFNEKAVLRLGRGLEQTGHLNADGMERAFTVLHRYHAVACAMRADPIEVLATAAVRDAVNGASFITALGARLPGVAIRVLSGEAEAALSARGVMCGIPDADGILADIGGGSLELLHLSGGTHRGARTLGLGVIRLAERAGGDVERARAIVDADLATVPWLDAAEGRDLYLVGGAWRALARVHMAQLAYPLRMVHQYVIGREEARELAVMIATAGRRALERLPGMPRRRIEDLPFAATVLRRLLRAGNVRRVVFSASGLREGWYLERVPEAVAAEDPLLAAARRYAGFLGRDAAMPEALIAWTAGLFPGDDAQAARLRAAACWMSDLGARDHPEFRAEQAFLRVFRQPGIGLDHHARAFLALTIALRYEADPETPFLRPARSLLDVAGAHRAEVLGMALRLAYSLSAGTPDLLSGVSLRPEAGRLVLALDETRGVFEGESVSRRLDRVAQAMGLEPVVRRAG